MEHTANFDWVGIELHGAYTSKSDLNRCKRVQEFLRSEIFANVIAILEPSRSTHMDDSVSTYMYVQSQYILLCLAEYDGIQQVQYTALAHNR